MNKTLGFISIFCISAGAMISSGLFVLPGLAFSKAGPAVVLSYLVGGLIALTTVFSLSELITAMPKAGGDYFYVSRSFGQLFGTVSGILSWLALSLKSAFAIIGISELAFLTFGIDLRISALILSVVFTVINLFGVEEAVKFQIILVAALILILISFFTLGIMKVEVSNFDPFLSEGLNALFSTAGFVFVSFGGVLTTASIAGEVKNPAKNIPLGLISSTIAVTILYTLITFVVVGLINANELKESLAPVALAGKVSGGSFLYFAIMTASVLAFITTANGGILTASRYPLALAKDKMLPRFFIVDKDKGKKTPVAAIIFTGFLIAVSVTLKLDLLIKAASTVILLSNIFAHLSVIVMRESKIHSYKPAYYAPFYPWLQIVGIVAFILLIIDMGIEPILLSLLFVSAGIILYFIRRGKNENFSSALIHLIERITNKKIVTVGLADELKEIIENRDNINKDFFDLAIESSCHLDLDRVSGLDDLWQKIGKELHLCYDSDLSIKEVVRLLSERENESTTALNNFVAIPHLIAEGENIFKLMLVRIKDGLFFNEEHKAIKAIFIILGSRDRRTQHLRALAAIAQIIQNPDFEKKWLELKDFTHIKDMLVLTDRRRI